MATKTTKKKTSKPVRKQVSKSNTNKRSPVWVIVGIVAIIAILGIAIRLFSNAGTATNFNPVNATSRQALAAFAYRASGSPAAPSNTTCGPGKSGPFADVPGDHAFCKEIEWAKNNEYLQGYSDNTFKPANVVNRDILALVMYRMAGSPAHQPSIEAIEVFSDVSPSTTNSNAIFWAWDAGITKGYSDGTYRPQSAASRQAAVTFLHRLKQLPTYPTDPIYTDVSVENPFYGAIQWMGSLSAKPKFNPTSDLSRQALAVFAYRVSGAPTIPANTVCGEGKQGPFVDVSGDYAFCKEIEWAKNNGILTGYSDNTFKPTNPITRANLALVTYRLAGKPAMELLPTASSFTDVNESTTNYQEIRWAEGKGLISGYPDGSFKPQNNATRQSAAEIFYKLKNKPAYPNDQIYSDVLSDNVFYPAIQWLGSLKSAPANQETLRKVMFFDEDNGNKQGAKNNTQ